MKRLLVSQTETLADVQHVYLRTGNHDPDQGVVSGTESLEVIQKKYKNTEVQIWAVMIIFALLKMKKM